MTAAREALEILARSDTGDVADYLSGVKTLDDLILLYGRRRKCCGRAR